MRSFFTFWANVLISLAHSYNWTCGSDLHAIKWPQKASLLISVDDIISSLINTTNVWVLECKSVHIFLSMETKKHLHIKCLWKSAGPLHMPHSGILCVGLVDLELSQDVEPLQTLDGFCSLNSHTATLVTITRSCKSQAHGLLLCVITRERAPVSYRLRCSCISMFILCPCKLCFTIQSF